MHTPHLRTKTCIAALLALAIALPIGGCKEDDFDIDNPVDLIMLVFVGATARKAEKLEATPDVNLSGHIGGLTGTYDIQVGTWGWLTGTATIKGQKKAKVREEGGANEKALIEAAIDDQLGVEIDVTKSKFKYNGSQTTGGVQKKFNLKVKFEGTVKTGENAGKRVKGKIKTKGKY